MTITLLKKREDGSFQEGSSLHYIGNLWIGRYATSIFDGNPVSLEITPDPKEEQTNVGD